MTSLIYGHPLGLLRDFLCKKSCPMGAKAAFLIRPADLGVGGPQAGLGQLLDPPQQGRLTSFHTVATVALFMGVWAVLELRPPTLGPSQAALWHQGWVGSSSCSWYRNRGPERNAHRLWLLILKASVSHTQRLPWPSACLPVLQHCLPKASAPAFV